MATSTVLGNCVGGVLFDRWSSYKTMLMGIIVEILSTGFLIFQNGWPTYAIMLIILGFGNGIELTGINAYATLITSRHSSYVFNMLYFTSNLGLVIGTLIVGLVLQSGISYIFLTATVMFIIFMLIAIVYYKNGVSLPRHTSSSNRKYLSKQIQIQIIFILFVFAISWIDYEQWQSNISTFMVSRGFTVQDYSYVWTFNAVLIVAFQPILTYFDDWLYEHMILRLNIGFTLFALSFCVLLFSQVSYMHILVSMFILTMGEILAIPGVAAYVNSKVPYELRGEYQGIVNASGSAGKAIGPLIGAQLIERVSYEFLFVFCSIIMLSSVFLFNMAVHISSSKKSGNK
ncbi:MFS transporter [Tetragenococcus halophilus]|uniref:MFS transporter n=1 Tax=Tetragenococcus halophilus TaxID=51669 RepID=UPI00300F9DF0